jgi:hypothetical protein
MERASVGGPLRRAQGKRARSNKFSGGDSDTRPRAHSRKGNWVGGYVKRDGTKVKGYYRTSAQYRWL